MDWNAKWDCESFAAYGSKTTENPKKLQLVDWTIINDREIDAGSFNLSAGGGNYGSGSDGGHASSAKSSLSASDSFTRDEQTPDFRLLTYEGLSGDFNDNIELEGTKAFGTSPPLEASTGSVEPLNGLKLGKRTYFENGGGGGHVRSTSSVVPNPSTTTSSKRTKWPSQNLLITRCVVEGCNVDLSAAKEYHRKHRVCESHSKSSKVVVGGLERRFCQQCSRFHNLSEFDERKRSCRRRLSDHNARRRKPQQDAIQFNSARLSSPFYGGRHQMSLLFNNVPLLHSRNPADTMSDSKFTLTTRGRTLKSTGDGVSSASKTSLADLSNLGGKGSQLDAGPEYGRALSLLSSNSWAPCGPALNPIHENDTMHEGVPLSSPEVWLQPHYQSTYNPPRLNSNSNANFQEIQLFITPTYEADLYSQIMN